MRIGDMQIDSLIDGEVLAPPDVVYPDIGLDGWQPHRGYLDPCTGNQVSTLGGYLIRHGDRVVVVDAGIGSNPVHPMAGGGFRSALLSLGVATADVTDVVFSHLHLDHIGWATQDGKPYFPRATYRCDQRDWDHFCSPDYVLPEWEVMMSHPETDAARVRLAPVADRFEFFTGDAEVLPGVEALEAGGHTPGSTVLLLTSDGEQGALLGDLVHSQPELFEDKWNFVNHHDHKAGMESIERIRKRLVDDDIPFAAAHFPGLRWGRLTRVGARLGYEELPV